MAFTEAQRVKIRRYLGSGSLFLDSEPLLENAMQAVQSPPKPTNDTELLVLDLLTQLDTIMAKWVSLGCLETVQVGNIQVDPIRGRMFIAQIGRTLVGQLARVFSLNGPLTDCFSSLPSDDMNMPMQMSGRRNAG